MDVPAEPADLLDKTRYLRSSRQLPPEQEARCQEVIDRLSDKCFKRGQPVKVGSIRLGKGLGRRGVGR